MKLEPKLVREILLKIEDHQSTVPIRNFSIDGVANDVIYYHIEKLKEAGFIIAETSRRKTFEIKLNYVRELTYDGHEFLNKIRDESIWQQILAKAKEEGGSLPFNIMATLGEAYLKKKLGLGE
jgi:DNA-binding PadR family transcriptional regulator